MLNQVHKAFAIQQDFSCRIDQDGHARELDRVHIASKRRCHGHPNVCGHGAVCMPRVQSADGDTNAGTAETDVDPLPEVTAQLPLPEKPPTPPGLVHRDLLPSPPVNVICLFT